MLKINKNIYFQAMPSKINLVDKNQSESAKTQQSCIDNLNMPFYRPISFESTGKIAYIELIKGLNRQYVMHATDFNREDMNWSAFIDYIDKKYPTSQYKKPILIICHACSDGSEGYTILLEFFHKLGSFSKLEELKSRFRFIARDIDPEVIKKNKKGEITLQKKDIDYIKGRLKTTDTTFEDLFTYNGKNSYIVSPKLLNMFEFSTSNIVEEAEKSFDPEGNPSVVLFRNAWYHLTRESRENLTLNLHKNLSPNSLVVVGDIEDSEEYGYLQKAKFEPILDKKFSYYSFPLIFEKKANT